MLGRFGFVHDENWTMGMDDTCRADRTKQHDLVLPGLPGHGVPFRSRGFSKNGQKISCQTGPKVMAPAWVLRPLFAVGGQ